ncbi:lysoplasmalogenase [Gordonia sp. (in: high G+C Gram-positive bacteria)]|uniref:lysoplasmalogenase n=1 Tax=Gordonia sp. (in: high G+C Gram-positive bacteria) TaxID=84139 RepID=UPI0016BB2032|nr:lysoplasmalogenase [Gordonia sp. (in: high G+C Gram-positive bacteria)]NLG48072.1 lysoplasmalogenase [Gordonia sp. (in: high G+C Gram-positive bacteria)]
MNSANRVASAWALYLAWALYVIVAVVHVVALAVESPIAGPTKLLLMPFLAVPVVMTAGSTRSRATTALLLFALLFSWLGDGAGTFFPGGPELPLMLGFFGVAHLVYIVLFVRVIPSRRQPRWTLVYVCWWIAMLAVVGPHAGGLFVALAMYGVVLAGTAATAARSNAVVAIGGALFLVSDSLLAFRIFLPDAAPGWFGPAVMATYAAGQGLIVFGVLRARECGALEKDRFASTGARGSDR